MKPVIPAALAAALLALASGEALAQQVYAGVLTSIEDTTASGCGGEIGDHQPFWYRPKTGEVAAGIHITFEGIGALVTSADPDGEFKLDNTKGKMAGTIHFVTGGGVVAQRMTMKRATYRIKADSTDPEMIKITKMTADFTIKESDQPCSFVWNGVMTPALMPVQ